MKVTMKKTCAILMSRYDWSTWAVYRKCRKQGMPVKDSYETAQHLYRDKIAAKNLRMYSY